MKKLFLTALSISIIGGMAHSAAAIVLKPQAGDQVPMVYAKIHADSIIYEKQSTAFCSNTFNKILEAYGLHLKNDAVADVPTSYAKKSDDGPVFNKTSTAYEPAQYHSIFTSYGLELSPEEVKAKLGAIDYAKVVDNKVVFAKGSYAYSGADLATILSAYNLPMAAGVAQKAVDTDQDGVIDAQDKCPGTPKNAKIDERGCWVLNANYLFDFDKATIKPQYVSFLVDVAKVLQDNPALKIEIQGNADSTGPAVYNQGLSERRAKAVKDFLIKKGIDASRLSSIGFGEEKPIASNATAEGRAKNRRVELKPLW